MSMNKNAAILYGSGASCASGYIINTKIIVDNNTKSQDIKPPTDQSFFKDIPAEYIKLRYNALALFRDLYYPQARDKSMEEIWTDVDINHKHVTLDTYNWKSESNEYLHNSHSAYFSMDLINKHFKDDFFDTSPMYNRYKFLGDCGRDFRKLIYDIYSNYRVPTAEDYYKLLHRSLASSQYKNISYLTFNYDCYLEQSLSDQQLKYIGINDRTDCYNALMHGGIPILKLHGSLSREESQNGYIYKVTFRAFPYSKESQVEPQYDGDVKWCQPAIIPPTIFKQEINNDSRLDHDLTKTILQQWRAAITVLAEADILIIVGYSFPVADHHVARLFRISNMIRKRNGGKQIKVLYCCGPSDNLDDRMAIMQDIFGQDSRIRVVKQFEKLVESDEFKNIID